jgi:rubrerythrin
MTMTSTHAEIGVNRTGVATSPLLTKEMLEGRDEFSSDTPGDEREIAQARGEYARDADPIGSVPPPLSPKGILKTVAQALKGESPALFIDLLGARLAYERSGTRLYEAVLSKFDALGSFPGGPTRAELESILNDEFLHFQLLESVITRSGADPTVMTPSADLQATLSKGAFEVVLDARTSLAQCLEAILLVELADNDCWGALVELARQAGEQAIAAEFVAAFAQEEQHLSKVRSWLAAAQGR